MEEFEQLKKVYCEYTTELHNCESITPNIRAKVIDRHELTVKLALKCMVEYFHNNNIECKYVNSYRYIIRKAIKNGIITNKKILKQIGTDINIEYTDEFEKLCYYKKICEQYNLAMEEFIQAMSDRGI